MIDDRSSPPACPSAAARSCPTDAEGPRPADARGRGHPALGVGGARPRLCGGGALDGFWERNSSAWDIAAGLLIVREAGGFVEAIAPGEDPLVAGVIRNT
jgi:hypothetical protein